MADLAAQLHGWRQRTGDVIPTDLTGSRIAQRSITDGRDIADATPPVSPT